MLQRTCNEERRSRSNTRALSLGYSQVSIELHSHWVCSNVAWSFCFVSQSGHKPVFVWWWPLYITCDGIRNQTMRLTKIGRHSLWCCTGEVKPRLDHYRMVRLWPRSDKWLFTGLEWAKTNASNNARLGQLGCIVNTRAKGRFCLWSFVLIM